MTHQGHTEKKLYGGICMHPRRDKHIRMEANLDEGKVQCGESLLLDWE